MPRSAFQTVDGRSVPAVTAREMAAVDRVAVEDVGLGLLQMMENAGRILGWHVRDVADGSVIVVAGDGGNGGGGLAVPATSPITGYLFASSWLASQRN